METRESTPTSENMQAFDRKLEGIRANPDLNSEAKRRMIQEAYDEATKRHQELVEEQERQSAEQLTRLERGVFQVSYPFAATDAEKEMARMSYRDAYDKAYYAGYLEDPQVVEEELDQLLTRAERSDDPQLATAVYHVATEKGIRSVADRYLESHPKERGRWEKYVAARQEADSVEKRLFGPRNFGPRKPAELGGF